jgi:hypothetical protein
VVVEFSAFGVPLEVRAPPELAPSAQAHFPPMPAGLEVPPLPEPTRPRRYEIIARPDFWELRIGGTPAFRGNEVTELLRRMAVDAKFWVASVATAVSFVHAGVVAFPSGAVVLPGATHAGKTTLVGELLRAGGAYYSDDYAVFDRDGLVWPFPEPLAIREPEAARARRPPEHFGATSGRGGIRVSHVIRTRYRENAVFTPERLSPGQTVLALFDHAPGGRFNVAETLARFSRAVRDATGLAGERGDARTTAGILTREYLTR